MSLISTPARSPKPTNRTPRWRRIPATVVVGADQAVNTASNFVGISIVTHGLSSSTFATFAAAQTVTLLAQVTFQAGSSDQLLTVSNDVAGRGDLAVRLYRLVTLSAFLSVVVLGLSAFGSSPLRLAFAVAAYILAVVCTDFVRNCLYAFKIPQAALLGDVCLASAQIASLVLWKVEARDSAQQAWVALAAPYVLFAVLGLIVLSTLLRQCTSEDRSSGFRWRYALEIGATLGVAQIGQLVFLASAGLAFAGQYRAAQLLMGPALLAITFSRPILIATFAVPRSARVNLAIFTVLPMMCVVWGVICLLLPDSARKIVLGNAYGISQYLILATTLMAAAQALFAVAFYRARARSDDRWTTRGKFIQAGTVAVMTAVAVAARSGETLIVGFALAALLPVVLQRRRAAWPARVG